ncbi:hypothetical protein F4859DRAFT_529011 [Xylaria cf. heliscus]|nr:hypothetical protein F4859DRAFT_529011 [Xylaria cf. heliscus]
MAPKVPRLSDLMFQGYHSGLRWETKGYKTHDANGNTVHVHRFLLHNPFSTHLAKVLFRNLEPRTKGVIGDCLSDIYNFAADNAHLCEHMEPEAFWAHAKNSWEWSADFRDDAFWAFTYKLFHARALYLDTVPRAYRPKGHPLIDALDRFRATFYNLYGLDSAIAPHFAKSVTQEDIKNVEDEIFLSRRIREAYFQYASEDSEGDGTDRSVTTVLQQQQQQECPDPVEEKYRPHTNPPAEFMEDNVGFYFDLGPRNPRYGHKDAYQEIEEALKKEKEEEIGAQQQATGLEEDIVMMGFGDEEDDGVGDIGMGGLGI